MAHFCVGRQRRAGVCPITDTRRADTITGVFNRVRFGLARQNRMTSITSAGTTMRFASPIRPGRRRRSLTRRESSSPVRTSSATATRRCRRPRRRSRRVDGRDGRAVASGSSRLDHRLRRAARFRPAIQHVGRIFSDGAVGSRCSEPGAVPAIRMVGNGTRLAGAARPGVGTESVYARGVLARAEQELDHDYRLLVASYWIGAVLGLRSTWTARGGVGSRMASLSRWLSASLKLRDDL